MRAFKIIFEGNVNSRYSPRWFGLLKLKNYLGSHLFLFLAYLYKYFSDSVKGKLDHLAWV